MKDKYIPLSSDEMLELYGDEPDEGAPGVAFLLVLMSTLMMACLIGGCVCVTIRAAQAVLP